MALKFDKKALWEEVTARIEDQVDIGLFFLIRNKCILDRIENTSAVIVAPSQTILYQMERYAAKAIQTALEELIGHSIRISFILGRSRIFEDERNKSKVTSNAGADPETELTELHRQYGDIMGVVDGHPVFRQACLAREKGGWGMFPELLTDACRDYGVLAVLQAVRHIGNRPGVQHPRARLLDELKRGKYGYKLAQGASILGL